ncbi:unnamed protein product [marine sediment metagenome]|uniref:Methyltransferase domain-containing protein n=1 Tax=marine sediment metagenome TaxID=412755 RepID=X1AGU9_9ZZZZ
MFISYRQHNARRADIVEDIIAKNKKRYTDDKTSFVCLDAVQDDLPRADLVICRDCLVHLSYADISRALQNIKKSGAKYFLTTTFPNLAENRDIKTGDWRPLNLQQEPFKLPEPLEIVNEDCPEKEYADKSLGLWAVSDL